jgi:cob(I)alamin adenosyltransferase
MVGLLAGVGGRRRRSQYNPKVTASVSVDQLLATLNAAEVGSLDAIAVKMRQVQESLSAMGQAALAESAGDALAALVRGDVPEFQRRRAYLQSKLGHLR